MTDLEQLGNEWIEKSLDEKALNAPVEEVLLFSDIGLEIANLLFQEGNITLPYQMRDAYSALVDRYTEHNQLSLL